MTGLSPYTTLPCARVHLRTSRIPHARFWLYSPPRGAPSAFAGPLASPPSHAANPKRSPRRPLAGRVCSSGRYQRPLTDDEFALALELEAEQAHLACAADGGGDALMADTFAAEEPPVAGVDAPLTPAAQRVVVGDGSTGAEGGPVGNERDNVCCNSSS